jgi:D-alanyl-D-alanine carboxypeptidase/D-alanyl-D-alanine-endopeptidase (penicillin-binding protein 4)
MKIRQSVWILLALLGSLDLCAKPIRPKKILKMIKNSAILNDHFTGFSLYNPDQKKAVVEQNADKYFTPASNTKLFTFYAGLKLLKDSIAALQFVERGDSLIFWGTGDPTFLDPAYKSQIVLNILKSSHKKIFWATGLYTDAFYGAGWAYDDYNEYYQPEISELPAFGNVLRISQQDGQITGYPAFSQDGPFKLLKDQKSRKGSFKVRREILGNEFYQPPGVIPANFTQIVPFKASNNVISNLLTVNVPGFQGAITYKKPSVFKTLYSVPADTVYKNMLLPSDNFIAEQLLLNIAATNGLEMNTGVVIDYVIKNFLQDLPDKPVWVDGSGLSRQDLFTPRSIVKLLDKIYTEVDNEQRLFNLLPNGGKTGTLKNLYKSEIPFVFAKTGSLLNNYNQSGYLVTKSGKRLIYSFMNNNFVRPTADVRNEMERIITYIHQNY